MKKQKEKPLNRNQKKVSGNSRFGISEVRIHNFRSIRDVTVRFMDYTLLVGANNAGKSNVIDAIRWFFGEISFDESQDFPHRDLSAETDDGTFVEVTFKGVTEDCATEWKAVTVKGGILRVRRSIQKNGMKTKSIYQAIDSSEKVSSLKAIPECIENAVVYIPSMSKPVDELRLTGSSALRNLVSTVFGAEFDKSDAYKQITEGFQKLESALSSSEGDDSFGLTRLESLVRDGLAEWGTELSLSLKRLSSVDLIKSLLDVQIKEIETGIKSDPTRLGSGFQRSLVFQLVKAVSEVSVKSGGFRLLLFEEPEAFLHTDQQEQLARNLRKMASQGYQVICTTHSPCFVGRKMTEVPSIVRLSKNNGVTAIHQLESEEWEKKCLKAHYPKWFKPQRDTTDLNEFRYALLFNGERAATFFAKKVLLVEGATEVALINRLRDDEMLRFPDGTVVVNCCGKFNFYRFMVMLGMFGIPFALLYDDDNNKGNHKDWNRLLEETAKSWKAKTLPLQGDLEKRLGIPKPSDDDLKPYELMSHYEKCKKIDGFCKDLEELCSDDVASDAWRKV